MAVTTYNELYSLLKDNEVLIEYNKAPSDNGPDLGLLNLKMTLVRDLISESDDSLKNYEVANSTGEWALSGDSDGALSPLARKSIDNSTTTYPNYLKAFSTNYGFWINMKISDIKSVKVLGELGE